jgi:glutathione S-transferase
MKLFYSPASPFVRKVMACAIAREIDRQIETVPTNPHVSPVDLIAANPLSKVPCLITSDGRAMFDSRVICEFLDSVGDAPPMFPAPGGSRWKALKQQAIGDGILDAAIAYRREGSQPKEAARAAYMARQKASIDRALDVLEIELPHRSLDIGTVTVACALGYLDFRFADAPWRATRPVLAAWFTAIGVAPALVRTVPKDAA